MKPETIKQLREMQQELGRVAGAIFDAECDAPCDGRLSNCRCNNCGVYYVLYSMNHARASIIDALVRDAHGSNYTC